MLAASPNATGTRGWTRRPGIHVASNKWYSESVVESSLDPQRFGSEVPGGCLCLHHPPSSQTPAESKDTNENKQQRGNLALVFTSKSFPMGLFSPLRTCHSSPTWTLLAGAPFPRNARDGRARKEAMAPGSSTPGSARPRSLIVGTGVS